jgi:hypothetical protein
MAHRLGAYRCRHQMHIDATHRWWSPSLRPTGAIGHRPPLRSLAMNESLGEMLHRDAHRQPNKKTDRDRRPERPQADILPTRQRIRFIQDAGAAFRSPGAMAHPDKHRFRVRALTHLSTQATAFDMSHDRSLLLILQKIATPARLPQLTQTYTCDIAYPWHRFRPRRMLLLGALIPSWVAV